MSERLWLVDSSLYVFRAWHSMPADMADAEGWPANAVQGFTRFVLDLLERHRPRRLAFAFDASLESNFRNELYPAYKANREPAPEELRRQFASCQAICAALGFPVFSDPRFEADDLIGSAASRARASGRGVLILSADKDLSQLLAPGDQQWDFGRDERWGHDGVIGRYGVHAHQIADYLGLTGDAIDNIPGVPGIGAKTAAALLAHFDSMDSLYQRLDEVSFLRLRGSAGHAARLREHREQALLSRRLATIALDAPLPDDIGLDGPRPADRGQLEALCERLRFGPLTRRRLFARCEA